MHRTRGYATTTDFSKEFARAAGVKEGHVTLDLFLGLGYVQLISFFIGRRRYDGPTYDCAVSHNAPHRYVSQEALDLGAERVVAFEALTPTQTKKRWRPLSPAYFDGAVVFDV